MTIQNALVFAGAIVATVFLILAGRSILKAIFRPIRLFSSYIIRPIYNWTLRPVLQVLRRLFGLARKSTTPLTHGAPAQLGVAPYKSVVHLLEMSSLADAALGAVSRALKAQAPREGFFFRRVNAKQVADSLHGTLTAEEAHRNNVYAQQFYQRKLGQDISPGILYEDSEETLVINMLKETDLPFFFVLRRINRNVSRNALKVISLMTAATIAFPFAAAILFGAFRYFGGGERQSYYAYAGMCLFFLALLPTLRMFHGISARANGNYLNYFVQTYFGRLSNQYQSAATAFANVLNDRSMDSDAVKENGDMWFVNLHWLSIRQWFLELYVRNIFFQIGRNLWWYYLSVPVLFVAVLTAYLLFLHAPLAAIRAMLFEPGFWIVASPFVVLFWIYGLAISGLLAQFWIEITPDGWLDFRAMNIKAAIEGNIGPIVKEVVDKRRNPYGSEWRPASPPPRG
ncbi:MAG TPA: hypothetical protein VG889_07720 [Rhizomicrobium sp.]|nr:hypothetical protein [Rhizomicrobium sp.]